MSNFKFFVPCNLKEVKKGDKTDWMIEGLASTEDKDLQNEIVKQEGLDISPIKEGRGKINFEHSNDAADIIGQLKDAWFTPQGLNIKGYLFKNHRKAQDVYGILSSLADEDKKSMNLSIEGKIIERSGPGDRIIKRAKIDRVAITTKPVNPNTYVELVKSLQPNRDNALKTSLREAFKVALIKKAMSVGYSQIQPPAQRTGAGATVKEHIDTAKNKTKKDTLWNLVKISPELEKLWQDAKKEMK